MKFPKSPAGNIAVVPEEEIRTVPVLPGRTNPKLFPDVVPRSSTDPCFTDRLPAFAESEVTVIV